ncbi:MAG TPA: lytic transglycosylase domain-containing protein [Edaphobacter sp.]
MKLLLVLLSVLFPCALNGQGSRAFSEQCVQRYASRYHIEPEVISAFIDVESGWNPRAISPKGAIGLMQLMPATARRFGAFDPFDPDQNIAAGTRYITTLMWEFHGDLRLVAAAYTAGDKWVGKRLLEYRNPDVVAYVTTVRMRYILRRMAAHPQHRR